MARKYFGTDGIRGRTNASAMTAEMAMKVGQAAGAHFLRGDHKHRVVIGKDTRLSGYMVENALVAGFTSVGMDVVQFGPIPTPAVALLTRSMRADLGVMISASHNPYEDNGIKLFGPDGFKLSDADELAIEALLDQIVGLVESGDRAAAAELAAEAYLEHYEVIEGAVIDATPDINTELEPLLGAELRRQINEGATPEEIQSMVDRAKDLLAQAVEALEIH